jgi:hypothetical protein
MEKNYNVEMDFILEELIREYENLYKGDSFYTEEIPKTTKEKITHKVIDKFKLKEWEINVLIYTLLVDKYVKSVDPLTISLEGLVFRNNGGYVESAIQKNRESLRLENIQNDFKKYSFGLMVFTAIVALGTLISAWFFAIEIFKYYRGVEP